MFGDSLYLLHVQSVRVLRDAVYLLLAAKIRLAAGGGLLKFFLILFLSRKRMNAGIGRGEQIG